MNSGMIVRRRRTRHGHLRRLDADHHRQQRRLQAAQVRRPERADLPQPEAGRRTSARRSRRARSSPTAPRTYHGELALGRNVLVALHGLGRLQLRGRHHHQRAAGEGRHLHLDPHRGVRDRDPRDQARPRGVHPRHPQRLARRRCATSTRTASSAIGTYVKPGDILVGKVSPKSQERADARREAAARHLRPGRRGREERLAGSPVGRRRDRHQHRSGSAAG